MGYVDMDSRRRSVLSGPGSSLNIRGQALKSSPFSPNSSNKWAQGMINDHMMSHYKRIYSAKAVIDTSVPKSLTQSVKYSDRMRQEYLKKGGRPQSAHSLSHRNSRASCYSAQSRCSMQSECRPYLCSRNSVHSSPGLSRFLHANEVSSPSTKANHQRPYSAVELKFRSQELTSQGRPSGYPCASGKPSFKAFRDPVQKTYSGDLLEKHSQHFTQEKPFTPKMLKSQKSSYLSSYRYYRAPWGANLAEGSNDLKAEKRAKTVQQELDEPPQEVNKEQQSAEDKLTGTYSTTAKQLATKNRDYDPFDHATSDEELMYLEFINDVTEDILSRGSVSNRILDRVVQRHIDMNLHRLDEAKMRHLLDILRNNLDEPSAASSYSEGPGRKDLLDSLMVRPESTLERVTAEEDNNRFDYASENNNSPEHCLEEPMLSSTQPWSPERSSLLTASEKTEEEDNREDVNYEEQDEGDYQPVVTKQEEAYGVESHRDQAGSDTEENPNVLEDLERRFSDSLRVEKYAKGDNLDSSSEQQTYTLGSVSEDDF